MTADSPLRLCAHLQCKALMGRRFASGDQLQAALLQSDSQFSCLHSAEPWGPDQAQCAPEFCQSGRACFELSARDPSGHVQS